MDAVQATKKVWYASVTGPRMEIRVREVGHLETPQQTIARSHGLLNKTFPFGFCSVDHSHQSGLPLRASRHDEDSQYWLDGSWQKIPIRLVVQNVTKLIT
jgi:hypothetical protein